MGVCSEVLWNSTVCWVVGTTSERDRIEMEVDAFHLPILSRHPGWDSKSRSVKVTWCSIGGTAWRRVGRESSSDLQVSSNETGAATDQRGHAQRKR